MHYQLYYIELFPTVWDEYRDMLEQDNLSVQDEKGTERYGYGQSIWSWLTSFRGIP